MGVFAYPIEDVVEVVKKTLSELNNPLRIVLVLFSEGDYAVYKRAFT
jgi:O-acetyl-ADP-ribose deacetylase (regulator of RNase III)